MKKLMYFLITAAIAVSAAACTQSGTDKNGSGASVDISVSESSITGESDTESSKEESSKQESSKQESSKQESSKQESSKQESSRQESSKQESSKQESSKQESSKQETSVQQSSVQKASEPEHSKQEQSSKESVPQTSREPEKRIPPAGAVGNEPGRFSHELFTVDEYYEPIKSGAMEIEVVTYTHAGHEKKASVYLPPNYDKNKKYNVLYLLGGVSANQWCYFKPGVDDPFRNILDNLMTCGKADPVIVVGPAFYPSDDIRIGDADFDYLNKDFRDELRNVIIPTVETKYSTYLTDTTPEAIEASRKHRAIGGFSMGSSITWDVLAKDTDLFYYYLPMSGGNFSAEGVDYKVDLGDTLKNSLDRLGYNWNDLFIFSCEGSEDHTKNRMEQVINDFKKNHSDIIRFTENDKSKGNISYILKQGANHKYPHAYQYICNGIVAFWNCR